MRKCLQNYLVPFDSIVYSHGNQVPLLELNWNMRSSVDFTLILLSFSFYSLCFKEDVAKPIFTSNDFYVYKTTGYIYMLVMIWLFSIITVSITLFKIFIQVAYKTLLLTFLFHATMHRLINGSSKNQQPFLNWSICTSPSLICTKSH